MKFTSSTMVQVASRLSNRTRVTTQLSRLRLLRLHPIIVIHIVAAESHSSTERRCRHVDHRRSVDGNSGDRPASSWQRLRRNIASVVI